MEGRMRGVKDEAPVADLNVPEVALVNRWQESADEEIDSRSLGDAIRSTLAGAIVDRELPPGWRLRVERLAAIFGVSRTPVREALAGLANSNLARRDSRGSLRVGSVTTEQIRDVYAVRGHLEGLSAALAAETATTRTVAILREMNEACKRAAAAGDFQAFAAANNDFHGAIARSTGNELLIRFLDDVHIWVKRFPTTTLSYPGRPESALAEHEQIIDAIEQRDGELAERLAREHMRAGEEIRIRMLAESDPEAHGT
jgi:DNA-binding GntR family transcriptional regulator